jgi:hypothetical protein
MGHLLKAGSYNTLFGVSATTIPLHIAVLKWGRLVRWLTDEQNTLLDYHIVGPYELNHAHKEIRVGWLQ